MSVSVFTDQSGLFGFSPNTLTHSDELRRAKVHHCASFDLSYMFPVLLLAIILTTFANQFVELKFCLQ
jgi:hypothetical protein